MEYKYDEGSTDETTDIHPFFRSLGDSLAGRLADRLILVDALSDIMPVASKYLDWTDLYFIGQTMNYTIDASDSILFPAADADLDSRVQNMVHIFGEAWASLDSV